MTLPLTPAALRGAYEFLCATEPFCRWDMPSGEAVKFRVGKAKDMRGWVPAGDGLEIVISQGVIGHTFSLVMTMAHEMIHIYQRYHKLETSAEHGAAFNRLAKRVCKYHGFDPLLF